MRWPGADRGRSVDPGVDAILDDAEIVELDDASPPPAHPAPVEATYLHDRHDPTGISGIWRALEGL
jgi:hypothetical protein